jgi:hypothetical protein
MIDCETADEHYKTARVTGTHEYDDKLYEHAVFCPKENWFHALWTDVWVLVSKERQRQEALREQERSLHHRI